MLFAVRTVKPFHGAYKWLSSAHSLNRMFSYAKINAVTFTTALEADKQRIKFDETEEFTVVEI